eukprot:CAMPEP_0194258658 /NCGR_PEP_ID=MMETSP0158-20130606/41728_1 /TAXON_ID=33649 /ORGANISM="Thalassionema nitzschioides, Strain L26-B" /LENGTH=648 /DNA_ID=CAMNT_0038998139 /DNA_START=73 /DNA_END=2016 /DNA_ORIENTATION=-
MNDSSPDRDKEALLLNLIECRKWDDLVVAIQSDPSLAFQMMSKDKTSNDPGRGGPIEGDPLLHEVCKNQPPVSVIKTLLLANLPALRMRGINGLTPLHYAVSNYASAEIVKILILSYPFITRMRDEVDHALPLHLAAETGASRDVVLEILTAHPEGIYIRDMKDKTSMDYAEELIDPSDRKDVIDALNNGPLLCKVSKAAQIRIAQEHENKIRSINEIHLQATKQWEERYLQIQDETKRSEQTLKKQLAKERVSLVNMSERVNEKEALLDKLATKYEELELNYDEEQDKYKRLERQKINFQSNLSTEADHSRNLHEQLQGKDREISDLEGRLEDITQEKNSLEKEYDSQKEVIQMLVEEVEQIPSLESELKKKTKETDELRSEKETSKQTVKNLTMKVSVLEKTVENLREENSELLEHRESNLKCKKDLEKQLQSTRLLGNIYKTRTEKLHNCLKAIAMEAECWRVEDIWAHENSNSKKCEQSSLTDTFAAEIGVNRSCLQTGNKAITGFTGESGASNTGEDLEGHLQRSCEVEIRKGNEIGKENYDQQKQNKNNKEPKSNSREETLYLPSENEVIYKEGPFRKINSHTIAVDNTTFEKTEEDSTGMNILHSCIIMIEEKREEKETVSLNACEEGGSEAIRQPGSPKL